jgi:hypothetical protein
MPTGANSGMVLTSDAAGVARWSSNPTISASGITWGTANYVTKFGPGWVGLILSQFFDNGTNIGIATTTPAAKLDISTALDNAIRLNKTGTNYNYIEYALAWVRRYWTGLDVNGNYAIQSDANTAILLAPLGGSVAIGTGSVSSGARLEVAGQMKITGWLPGVGKVLTSDATGLASWIAPGAVVCPGTGINNTCYGIGALFSNTTGYENTANGINSLNLNNAGFQNTAFGANSLRSNTSWNYNTTIGNLAWWSITTGSSNIAIGYNAQVPNATLSNQLSIGNWIYGVNGDIGIGTTTPTARLDIAGNIRIQGGTPWAGRVLVSDATGLASWQSSVPASNAWLLTGNTGTLSTTNYLGTNDNQDLVLKTNNAERVRLMANGNLGINTITPDARLSVKWIGVTQATNSLWVENSAGSPALYVNDVGGVSIGSAFPWNRWTLFIWASPADASLAPSNAAIRIREMITGDKNLLLGIKDGAWAYGWIQWVDSNASMPLPLVLNASWGNVGIGTTTPVARLQISSGSTDILINPNGSTPSISTNRNEFNILAGSQNIFRGLDGWTWTWSDSVPTTFFQVGRSGWNTSFSSQFGVPFNRLAFTSNNTQFTNLTNGNIMPTNYFQVDYGANNLFSIQAWWSVGIGTLFPWAYKLNVAGDTYVSGSLTVAGKLFVDSIVNRTIANITVSGSLLPDSAAPLVNRDIGSNAQRWNNLYLSGQVAIGGGSPWLGKILTSDATGLASWSSAFSGTTSASGITGGTQNYITKFGIGGNGLVNSQIFDNGANVGVGITTWLTTKLVIDSGINDDSGLRLLRLNPSSPLTSNGVIALWIDGSGKVLPISPISNIAVYNGVDRVTALSPNPDLNTFNITYDFNRYFAIPGKQSFVVSNWSSSSYNGPYFKENGVNALCSMNGTYGGAGAYDCADPDPATLLSASPYNSFTMTAKGDVFGYQLALGARGDAPLFARSGRYNWFQTGWLYTNDAPYQTPAPWQKVLSVPANHPEYFFINTGLSSQLQAIAWGGNVGIGTTTPQSRFEVWTGATTTSLIHFRGTNNVGMGLWASRPAQTGNANTAFWNESLFTLSTGYSNTAIWYRALRLTAAGFNNSAVWQEALFNNNGWSWNAAMWYQSLYSVTSWSRNVGIGSQSLYNLSTGNDNVALGYQAARGVAGSSVSNNIAIGYQALYSTTSSNNVGIGYQALYNNTSGVQNTAIGYQSLDTSSTTSNNTALGYNTLAATTGGENTAIGTNAGSNLTTGSNNITIGSNAQLASNTTSNQLNIGNWIYGNGGNIGIGISWISISNRLTVDGNILAWVLSGAWGWVKIGWVGSSGKIDMLEESWTPWNELNLNFWQYATSSISNIKWGIGYKAALLTPGSERTDIYIRNMVNGTITNSLYINGSGNVGIGTTTPWARLEVVGQVKITGWVPWAGKILMSDATGLASWQTPTGAAAIPWAIAGNAGTDPASNFVGTTDNFGLAFRTNNTEKMRILTSGNIGIGTNVPASLLAVNGNLSVGYPTSNAPINGAIINGNLGIGTGSPTEKLTVIGTIENPVDDSAIVSGNDRNLWFVKKSGAIAQITTSNAQPIIFSKLSTATITSANVAAWSLSELMRIQNNGDVGIGIATPWAKLDVNGQVRIQWGSPWIGKILVSDATGLASWQTAATGALAGWWLVGNAGTVATTNFLGTTDNVDLVLRTNGTEKMRVQSAGNVGIGIAAPGARLDVAGLIRSTNNNSAYFQGWDDAQLWDVNQPNTVGIVGIADATRWAIQLGNNAATYIAGSAGNIGIGVISPWAKLDINGTIKISWGTPWVGRVLTSDAAGLATWAPVTATLAWGTTNYLARWTSASTLGIGTLFDNGTNVWVGTISPAAKLDVSGNLAVRWDTGGSIYTWNGGDTNWRMGTSNAPWYSRLIATGFNQFQTFWAAAGNGFSVGDASTWLSAFEVTSSANSYESYFRWNVGIGVDPTQSLDVTGQVRIRGGSPWVGKYLVSDASGVGTWTTPASSRTGSYIYRMVTPQGSTSSTVVWVSQLTSTPLPVWPYQFEMIGKFQSAAATTGIGLTFAQTSGTSTAFIGNMTAQLTSSSTYTESFMSPGTLVISPSVPVAGTNYMVMLKGTFEVTATGTVAVQMASEVNGSQVTLGAGTALIIRSLDPSLAWWGI